LRKFSSVIDALIWENISAAKEADAVRKPSLCVIVLISMVLTD
jgi:hypothetical protein